MQMRRTTVSAARPASSATLSPVCGVPNKKTRGTPSGLPCSKKPIVFLLDRLQYLKKLSENLARKCVDCHVIGGSVPGRQQKFGIAQCTVLHSMINLSRGHARADHDIS